MYILACMFLAVWIFDLNIASRPTKWSKSPSPSLKMIYAVAVVLLMASNAAGFKASMKIGRSLFASIVEMNLFWW